jgi:tRNA (guanine-N7-)-methyltransferase
MTAAITPEASAGSDGLAPTIRTFHPRRGRLSARHRDSLARLLPKYGFEASARPLVLEIGSGMGEAAVAMAAADPGRDYLAVEIHSPGIANLLAMVDELGLPNVRVVEGDALELLRERIGPDRLDAIHVFFPDPWPKVRHHKRRIVNHATVAEMARVMRPGAELRLATDDPDYARWMLEAVLAEPRLDWLAERAADWRQRPVDWPPTRYETKALAAGRRPVFFRFRRVDEGQA